MGYYHAVIDGAEKPRMDVVLDSGGQLAMPPLDGIKRLWDAWGEAGRTSGMEPLRWSEIDAYGRMNRLSVDDMITIRKMSEEYLEGIAMTHPLAKEPFEMGDTND